MFQKEEKVEKFFLYWLFSSLILVFLIIIIGGLTRLTNSGLSIIEWELFKGIFPPMNDVTWGIYFEKYKTIPQYKLLNFNMSLDEFKVIFYWEYIHRILARLIGLFVLIPLIFFYFSKKIKKKYITTCTFVFLLIIFQGLVGWYMVKSGLVHNTTVSHYRLALHLSIAVIIISTIFWLFRNVQNKEKKIFFKYSKDYLPYQFLLIIIFLQIILGALVSGLDAGMIYQTWPLMGDSYLPNDTLLINLDSYINFNNQSLMQFYHRNLAYLIIFYLIVLSLFIYRNRVKHLFKPLRYLLSILVLQIFLGIVTLLSGLNIFLASAHQISSVLLIFSALNLYFFKVK